MMAVSDGPGGILHAMCVSVKYALHNLDRAVGDFSLGLRAPLRFISTTFTRLEVNFRHESFSETAHWSFSGNMLRIVTAY